MQGNINNSLDYTVLLRSYIADIMENPDLSDKVRNLRVDAILQLKARLFRYKAHNYMDILLYAIAKKKALMIMQATTKTEMRKIIKLPKPHYDGCKSASDHYDVSPEEMVAWWQFIFWDR